MHIHFIAIGGKAMHNLALALIQKGYHITGSDDEIYDPSHTRLKVAGLLPDKMGWYPEKIGKHIDVVILGMHARPDNPELLRALELNINVVSYPEYIYAESRNKKRVVVAGSHGKTTTTSMIMTALKSVERDHDYMVGAQLDDYDRMVRLSDADIIVLEGDEYLSSPIDRRPKFLHYHPHIVIITGIAWDHINVFPTFEGYVLQFDLLISSVEPGGKVIYYSEDKILLDLILGCERTDITFIPYSGLPLDGQLRVNIANDWLNLPLIGHHNYQNMAAALVCAGLLGVSEHQFAKAMQSFTGASRRLQVISNQRNKLVFIDYAHAPSKVKATTQAVRTWYKDRKLVVILELHTFSSLNKAFLPEYKNSLKGTEEAIVYYDNHTISMKKMEPLTQDFVKEAFGNKDLSVINNRAVLEDKIKTLQHTNDVFLFMSSGTFSGMNLAYIFHQED
jgi:UDP-N-acetylmuramate: L-alanyl-gamma-D-glutamyl-meso-diaminopimelate ligase